METYEVEIKTLLGSKENAEALIERMKAGDPNLALHGSHTQLNHYFEGGDLARLYANLSPVLPAYKQGQFKELTESAADFSIRTREADGTVIFVMKASVDDSTSSNGVARREFEATVEMPLSELDRILLDSGFDYQAKWSRERQEFTYKGTTVTIDKNAGYGYLAEFESVTTDPTAVDATKETLAGLMAELGVEELKQDRLARMFDYYNKNWREYYGTDNVFTIE